MDIEKLIEQLRGEAGTFRPDSFAQTMLLESATSLSTLQAENEKMRAEMEQVKRERDAAVERIREWEKFDTYLLVHSFITPEKWRGQKED